MLILRGVLMLVAKVVGLIVEQKQRSASPSNQSMKRLQRNVKYPFLVKTPLVRHVHAEVRNRSHSPINDDFHRAPLCPSPSSKISRSDKNPKAKEATRSNSLGIFDVGATAMTHDWTLVDHDPKSLSMPKRWYTAIYLPILAQSPLLSPN